MSDNKKNQLQIYCQRNGYPMPEYIHQQISNGNWVSTVRVRDRDGGIGEFIGEERIRKTHADISAAGVAVAYFGLDDPVPSQYNIILNKYHTIEDYIMSFESDQGMVVLVDYENVNKLEHLHNVWMNEATRATIYKFVSYGHHKADTLEPSHLVQSGGNDAVDHAISLCVGILLSKGSGSKRKCLIVSGDHFAECLKNICDGRVLHAKTERQAISILHEHGYAKISDRVGYSSALR